MVITHVKTELYNLFYTKSLENYCNGIMAVIYYQLFVIHNHNNINTLLLLFFFTVDNRYMI